MKKIIKIALCFFLLMFLDSKALALTLEQVQENDVWIFRKGGGQPAFSSKFTSYTFDNKMAYCIEPGKHINTDTYTEVIGLNNLPFAEEINNKLQLIGYYGYDYPGHQTLKYKMATQALIWETVNTQVVEYWTKASGAGSFISVKNEKNAIMELVNNHKESSFSNLTINAFLNEEVIFEDNNKVLDNYEIINNTDAYIHDNKVYITPKKIGNIEIKLKRITYNDNKSVLFVAEDNESQKMAYFGSFEDNIITLKVKVNGGKIKINKFDSETKSCKSKGDALLSGAIYGVYDINNALVSKIEIDANCSGISSLLPYGNYVVKEISPSLGYLVDDNTYNVTLDDNNINAEIESLEKEITNKYKIFKVLNNKTTGILEGEANITFEFYLKSTNELYARKSTDRNGFLEILLPYGTYIVRQINTTSGYSKSDDFEINVTENSDDITKIIADGENTARLKVIKIDNDSHKPIKLAGFKFKIKNIDTNNYVCMITNKVTCEYETNMDGIMITPLPLGVGNYLLEEVDTVGNYLLNNNAIEFSINDDSPYIKDEIYGSILEIKYTNQIVKGNLNIIKFGENYYIDKNNIKYAQELLDNVEFSLYADEDITGEDGNVIYHKDELVKKLITNNGYANINNLYLGKYYLIETKTNNDYILDTNKYCFELKYIDKETPIVNFDFEIKNYLKKGTFELLKIDSESKEYISDTTFNIYNDKNEIIYTGKTNEEGKLSINLPYGKYSYKEIEANSNYILDDTNYPFTIDKDLVTSVIENQRIYVPNTLSNNNYLIQIVLMIVGLLYAKKKKI